MIRGVPLPPEAEVCRFVRPVYISDETGMPLWTSLVPTSTDKATAKARSTRVRVSVWDMRLIVPGAARLREGDSESRGYAYLVGAIEKQGRADGVPLEVVEDPDGAPPHWIPSIRAAHAGIEGLVRQSAEPRPAYRARLQRVAELGQRVIAGRACLPLPLEAIQQAREAASRSDADPKED